MGEKLQFDLDFRLFNLCDKLLNMLLIALIQFQVFNLSFSSFYVLLAIKLEQ